MLFDELPWQGAVVMGVWIDRSAPGIADRVDVDIAWPCGKRQRLSFLDCYRCHITMNWGVVAEEVVLTARKTWVKNEDAGFLEKWHAVGVDLNALACYALVTEATHSAIQIYAMRFMLADIEEDRDARYCQDS